MEHEGIHLKSLDKESPDEFELELHQALARRSAPPGLKRRLMQRRDASRSGSRFPIWRRLVLQQLAASLVLTAVLAGALTWRVREERRKEEAARQQVMTALRITSRTLYRMNASLAAHDRRAARDE